MKLIFDGEPAYSPALGLDLVRGEHEYPDEHEKALLALGLKRPAVVRRAAPKEERED